MNSSAERYPNIIAANIVTYIGANSPNTCPPAADKYAPDAFRSEMIAFADKLSGLFDNPILAPTEKLSVLLPHASRITYHILFFSKLIWLRLKRGKGGGEWRKKKEEEEQLKPSTMKPDYLYIDNLTLSVYSVILESQKVLLGSARLRFKIRRSSTS